MTTGSRWMQVTSKRSSWNTLGKPMLSSGRSKADNDDDKDENRKN